MHIDGSLILSSNSFLDGRPLSAFDVNCNDTMAVVGTLNEEVVRAAELGFFDTRQTRLIHKFEESHGDDVTEVTKGYLLITLLHMSFY
jgi:hypothetical protein